MQTKWTSLKSWVSFSFLLLSASSIAQTSNAQTSISTKGICDTKLLSQIEADFDKLARRQADEGESVNAQTSKDMEIAARNYISMNAKCFDQLYKKSDLAAAQTTHIDDGGIRFRSGSGDLAVAEFNLLGTKWGANSPFNGGQNVNGPRSPGGVVTYSFIPRGVSNAVERSFLPAADNNLPFSSLPTYSSCFETEITRAFAMWSAVADIDFRRVRDNGVATNGRGATGDIRIGAHTFDGNSSVLAHAFFPPPNGGSIAGDLHFDRAEAWSCDTSGIDIGIVATHEVGHSIGLNHEEQGGFAIMNPFYNPSLPIITTDDINGIVSIYGPKDVPEPEPEEPRAAVVFLGDDLPVVIPVNRQNDECRESLGSNPNTAVSGSWTSDCASISRQGSFARYYTFELSAPRSVTINLDSAIDTYLYLLTSSRGLITFDDDGGSGLNSRIQTNLSAGRYIIEATTFQSAQAGGFVLRIQ